MMGKLNCQTISLDNEKKGEISNEMEVHYGQ